MKKTLIAYFSRTGITKKLAQDVVAETGADIFAIEPVKAYSSSYVLCVAQAKIENLKHARPEIKEQPKNLASYDTVVVMFPIWWFTCPNIILSFLEANDFAGKKIIPVCTYGSSGKGSSEKDMQAACSSASFSPCIEATDLKDKACAAIVEAIEKV